MSQVTIEGSITPSVVLARGERRTVQRTARIDRLIARGYVVEVDDAPEDAAPEQQEQPELDFSDEPAAPEVPKLNASRDDWATYLDAVKIPYTDDDGRDDLVRLYQGAIQS